MSLYYRLPAIVRYWQHALRNYSPWTPTRSQPKICFRCNVCGRRATASTTQFTRHAPSCRCGSSVRVRAIVHVLTLEIFGESLAIPDIPLHPKIRGIDMSGAASYADRLRKRIGYVNTFLHKQPRLDILSPGTQWLSSSDYAISSDVFEHVVAPVSRAFENTLQLLKPGGVLVLTVPYVDGGETVEHYPDLHDYQLARRDGKRILINRTRNGHIQHFDNLVFHGGKGATLEMRVFSKSGLINELVQAGFTDIRIHSEEVPEFGIFWPDPWSLPLSARRPENQS